MRDIGFDKAEVNREKVLFERLMVELSRDKPLREVELSAEEPCTLVCPPNIAHVFFNASGNSESFLLLAYTNRQYDPADTIPYDLGDYL